MSDDVDRALCACGRIFIRQPNDFDDHKTTCMYARIETLKDAYAISQNDLIKANLQVGELQKKLDRVLEVADERVECYRKAWEVTHGVGADGRHYGAMAVADDLRALIEKRKSVGPSDVDPMERTMPVVENPTYGGCGCTATRTCFQHQKGE